MNRFNPLLWFVVVLIFLIPTAAGRFLIDLAGGLILTLLALPLLLTGVGWIGWRILQTRLVKCDFCGSSIVKDAILCPVCGSKLTLKHQSNESFSQKNNSIPASSATIDITAKDAD